MKQQIARATGATSSNVLVMDTYISPFNVGMGVVVTGSVTFTVQHTFDNVLDSSITPTWFNHPTLTGTAGADGNYAFPVAAIRITNSAGSTGTARLTVIQAGLVGA
jgi:hypothetical protein